LQLFDIHNSTLQRVYTTGNPPSARFNHGSAVIEEHLYVFGGSTVDDHNLYSLNTKSKHWVTIPNTADSFPQPRFAMSMFSVDDKLYVFGGANNKDYKVCQDLNEFCVKTHSWKELSKDHKDYEFTPRKN
jgi:N-acetylneuraminic acid mutarotase